MYKKNILAIITMSVAQLIEGSAQQTAYYERSAFNPETTHFSQLATIKTWVANQHHENKELMQRVQQNVAMTIPQNPFSLNFMLPVKNNPEDKRYFGKSFRTLAALELPFLQYIKQLSAEREIITLEIAASIGMVSVKVPLAFGHKGTHYVNDLSVEMLNNDFQELVNSRLGGTTLKEHLRTLPADCFHLLEQEPSLRNKIDVIYIQNLEHFFNPVQHQLFLSVLDDLLAENGQAFLGAHSFKFGIDTSHPLFKLYSSRKSAGDVYPGFAAYDVEFTGIDKTQIMVGASIISNVSRPQDNAEIKKIDIGTRQKRGSTVLSNGKVVELFAMKQHIMDNSFSPSIYRNAVASHPNLEVMEAFFMDGNGNRLEKWGEEVTHAVAIIKKKTITSIEE